MRTKKICFLSVTGLGAAIRSQEMLVALKNLGYHVEQPFLGDIVQSLPGAVFHQALQALKASGKSGSGSLSRLATYLESENRALSATMYLRGIALMRRIERLMKGIDLIVAETSSMGAIARVISQRTNIPYVLDMHGISALERIGEYGCKKSRITKGIVEMERLAVADAVSVIAVSESMRNYICEKYGKRKSAVFVHRNGGRVASRSAMYKKPVRFVFGGMFSYWERPQDFIELAATMREADVEFEMFGKGPLRGRTMRIRNQRAPQVRIGGLLSREETIQLFLASQIGVAPSSTDIVRRVAWPIKPMDYGACGLPVLAQAVGEWSTAITNYDMGIVVDFADRDALRSAAKELCDEVNWKRMSRNAIETIRGPLSWESAFENLDQSLWT